MSYLCYMSLFNTYCVVFRYVCFAYPMLPVSLDCPFLVAPSVFSNAQLYLIYLKAVLAFKVNKNVKNMKKMQIQYTICYLPITHTTQLSPSCRSRGLTVQNVFWFILVTGNTLKIAAFSSSVAFPPSIYKQIGLWCLMPL